MRLLKNRYSLKRKALSIVIFAILSTLLFLALRGSFHMYQRMQEARALREGAEANLARLLEREVELQATVAALQSPRGVEAEVRKRFGVAKPGEGVIEIVEIRAEEEATPAPATFWGRLFDWF